MPQDKSKYDPFFSRSMEHPHIARTLFKQALPEHLLQPADLDTLVRMDRTNTDKKLAQRRRDIVYKAQMEDEIALLIGAEHQSQPDIMMPVRFLYYGVEDIAPYLKAHKRIPQLVQLLFYNGTQAPYPYPTTLQDYYGQPKRGAQELALRFYLIDATQISDQAFLKYGHCAPMCLLLKHGRDGNFELEAAAYQEVFQACVAAVGDDYIFTMLQYAAELSNLAAGEKIFHFIEEVLTDKTEIIMTYGQQLRQQGEQIGKQTRNLEIARTMLKEKEPKAKVIKFTGLTLQQIEKLRQELSKK